MESKFKKPSIAVIIPMYNEENVASASIDAVMNVIKTLNYPITLLIINDGSKDRTKQILLSKQKKYGKKLIVITHKINKGYGAALQSGINKALELGFTWGLHMDSDQTNDPKYIYDFIKNLGENYDCIKASRYIKGSKIVNVSRFRRYISVVGNLIAARLFNVGIKDCTNGFRIVRLTLLKDITFKENSFSIILEELYYLKKKKARFKEIPYTLTARISSHSHFTYKPKTFVDYLKYAIKSSLIFR